MVATMAMEPAGEPLFRRLLVMARNGLWLRVHTRWLADNGCMRAIARRHGAALSHDHGEVLASLLLPPPDALSVAAEYSVHWRALMSRLTPSPVAAAGP